MATRQPQQKQQPPRRPRSRVERVTCPVHKHAPVVEDYRAGDMVCSECGLVVGDRVVDVGSEWRSFGNSDKKKDNKDRSRVGLEEDVLLEGDQGLTISAIPNCPNADVPWMRWQSRMGPSGSTRTLKSVYGKIANLASKLSLTDQVVTTAKAIFKEVEETGAVKTRSHDSCAAASVYIACRNLGVSRPYKEICRAADKTPKEIGRVYRKIRSAIKTAVKSSNPAENLGRYISRLGLEFVVRKAATYILEIGGKLSVLEGRQPTTKAAAALLLAINALGFSAEAPLPAVSRATAVSESAIKDAYKELYPFRQYLFPAELKSKVNFADCPNFGPGANEETGRRQITKLQLQPTIVETQATAAANKYEQAMAAS
ncbi:hypothetical protein PTSG_05216 [Salpingoeca rosetta]|uniref:General transcription factor TFIIB n=1 Tax=Salpingoeca rosetta (strain ATCC 50818 / BSB-021) TaxID=946362 RepID=F2UAU6_SALR5|nr:uncharacterized protein PTSG_05216 [Salpingoeca rosetta]EGD73512.1 hypothetical protein PTSG_05216 [Salpingoeca rosetta]|eukprot:XP_004993794.1 hypothetical protein PTSG_05216 [Salpingoeca rosetta]